MIFLEQNKSKYKPRAEKGKKELLNWNGSSDILKKIIDFNAITNKRFLMIGFVICCFFVAIAIQLVRIQVYSQEEYTEKLIKYTTSYQKISPPRGQIYDRDMNLLVENKALLNIIYTPAKNATDESEWELARKIVEHYGLTTESYSIRDLQDAYINLYPNETKELITEDEWNSYSAKEITDTIIYQLKLSRITEEMLNEVSDFDLMTSIIKMNMDTANETTPAVILEDVSYEDAVYIAEHKTEFAGFDNSYDWQRNYLYGDLLKSVLGSVSTKKQGLPSEATSYFIALGYSMNERVGISGLEKQYEELLRGEYMYVNTVYDSSTGLPIQEIVDQGKKGYDIRISIDMKLQQQVEDIVSNTLLDAVTNEYRKYFDEMYVAMINPKTGEILSMVGKEQIDGKIYDKSYGTYMDVGAAVPGSVVKGATIYMALNEKVIDYNTYLLDTPLYFQGTPVKASWRNMGLINEIDALKWSSNVYMFRIAMKMAGSTYVENGPLYMKNRQETFLTFRKYFRSFGLGQLTGIDLPGESVGYIMDEPTENGHLLDYVIGQFDTYTVLQLVKYVGTIANNGIRVTPHLLIEAYETGTDKVVYQYDVNVEQVLENQKALNRVQEGFRECVTTGYCATYLNSVSEPVAAKSGTAEAYFYEDGNLISSPNNTFIAYAPYDKPEVAIACIAPHAWNDTSQLNVCQKVVADSLQTYFDLKESTDD